MSDWNAGIIDEFRANDGNVGGMFEGAPLLILHTTGAKTGQAREMPLMYLDYNDRLFVFASKAGAHSHPDWYFNATANPGVEIEIGSDRVTKTAWSSIRRNATLSTPNKPAVTPSSVSTRQERTVPSRFWS